MMLARAAWRAARGSSAARAGAAMPTGSRSVHYNTPHTDIVMGRVKPDVDFHLSNGAVLPKGSMQIQFALYGAAKTHLPLIYVMPSMSNTVAAMDIETVQDDGTTSTELGWWRGVIGAGPQYGIDTNAFRVLVAAPLGAPFGTTSPITPKPGTDRHWGPEFPQITPADQAACHALLLDHLAGTTPGTLTCSGCSPGTECEEVDPRTLQLVQSSGADGHEPLHAIVGGSMGGMQALHFAALYPERYKLAVSIASTGQTSPSSVALRTVQREVIKLDPLYKGGWYPLDGPGPSQGMSVARKCGTMAYRSREEFDGRFAWDLKPYVKPTSVTEEPSETASTSDPEGQGGRFVVEEYLDYQAFKFAHQRRYDPNCYMLLSRCMNLMHIGQQPKRGAQRPVAGTGPCETRSFEEGLQRIPADKQVMVLSYETDVLMPPTEAEKVAITLGELGAGVHHESLVSKFGHDAFLIQREAPTLNWRLAAFLDPENRPAHVNHGEQPAEDASVPFMQRASPAAYRDPHPSVSRVRRMVNRMMDS